MAENEVRHEGGEGKEEVLRSITDAIFQDIQESLRIKCGALEDICLVFEELDELKSKTSGQSSTDLLSLSCQVQIIAKALRDDVEESIACHGSFSSGISATPRQAVPAPSSEQ